MTSHEQQPASRPAASVSYAAFWVILAAFNGYLAFYTYEHSYFTGDDLLHFVTAQTHSLWQYVWLFVDLHFAPLHRLLNWLLQHTAPMNFGLAVMFIIATQLLSLRQLERLLKRIGAGKSWPLWTALYATNYLLVVPVIWWSSALHRIPHLLLALLCLNLATRFVDGGRWRDLLLAQLALATALGFYVKSMLVPVYFAGIELCRLISPASAGAEDERRAVRRILRTALCLLPMLALCVAQQIFVREHGGRFAAVKLDPKPILELAEFMVQFVLQSPLLVAFTEHAVEWNRVVLISYAVVALLTIVRSPRSAVAWLIGLLWLGLHPVVIGGSERFRAYGVFTGLIHRYYYEMVLPWVLCGGLLARMAGSFETAWLARVTRPAVVRALALGVLAFYAYRSLGLMAWFANNYYADHPNARRYLRGMLSAVAEEKQRPDFALLDEPLPPWISGYNWKWLTHRSVLDLAGIEVPVNHAGDGLRAVGPEGELMRVRIGKSSQLFPIPSGQLSSARKFSVKLDANRCLIAASPIWNALELPLPQVVRLGRAGMLFEYRTGDQPIRVDAFYLVDPMVGFGEASRQQIVLPAGATSSLVPLRPLQPGEPVSALRFRIDFPHRDEPYCITQIRLVEYSLE